MHYRSILRHSIIAVFATLVLIGCFSSTSKQPVLQEYLNRIASVQDEAPLSPPQSHPIELPNKRELLQPIERVTVGLIDSYQLRQCGLFQLIANKNSILGKVADPFRDFDYQIQLIAGLQSCLSEAKLEPELHEQLTTIQQQKIGQIHLHYFNLIFTSETMRQQLSGGSWLSNENNISTQMIKPALVQLSIIQKDIIEKSYLNSDYQVVKISDYQEMLDKVALLGKLTYSLQTTTQWLNITTAQLNKHDSKIRCGKNANTTKFKYMVNVFNRYYVQEVQPYVSFLDRQYQIIASQLSVFEPQQTVNLPRIDYPLKKSYSMFIIANRNHVKYWSKLFKRCNTSVQSVRIN